MTWHDLLPVAVFFVTFLASLLSGMAGGGGSFIIAPFYILIGLTPQQSVATGKFASLGLNAGAIAAFKERMLENKRNSIILIISATVIGLVASLFLQHVNNAGLQLLMGLLMLAMVPFMLRKARGIKRGDPTALHKAIGGVLLIVVLFLQGIVSGGIGSLVSAIFIIFFGATALEANMMKRKASIVLNTVIVLSLLASGLINYKYGVFGMAGGLIGGYVGSHIALKKGDQFAHYILLVFMVVSGIWLILTAK
jgi:uncharacterized membrane protein YfcA